MSKGVSCLSMHGMNRLEIPLVFATDAPFSSTSGSDALFFLPGNFTGSGLGRHPSISVFPDATVAGLATGDTERDLFSNDGTWVRMLLVERSTSSSLTNSFSDSRISFCSRFEP